MTEFGEYLNRKLVKKSMISEATGISTNRLSQLSNNPNTQIKAWEIYYVALAMEVDPRELFMEVCKNMKLPDHS